MPRLLFRYTSHSIFSAAATFLIACESAPIQNTRASRVPSVSPTPAQSPLAASPSPGPSAAPQATPSAEPSAAVVTLLRNKCFKCHGQSGTILGNLSNIDNLESLLRSGKVVPYAAARSVLFQRVQNKTMPPTGNEALTSDELAMLKKWIDEGAQLKTQQRPDVIKARDVSTKVVADLNDKVDKQSHVFVRYLSIAHLVGTDVDARALDTIRLALKRVVNSVSLGENIIALEPTDSTQLLYRIDLRQLGWTAAEQWKALTQAYPYDPLDLADPGLVVAQKLTTDPLPVVKADWFVSRASQPPLYYALLKTPATLLELEKSIGVDAATNIKEKRVTRSGFTNSRVSVADRIIERHEATVGLKYYWRSYEFSSDKELQESGTRSILNRPLGPTNSQLSPNKSLEFVHDGHELIYPLKNGMLGFALYRAASDSATSRIDSIVQPSRESGRLEETMVAGLSCFGCHSKGLQDKTDSVRAVSLSKFSGTDLSSIQAIYLEPTAFSQIIARDTQLFEKSLVAAGLPLEADDSALTALKIFEAPLGFSQIAAEFGLSPTEFKEKLAKSSSKDTDVELLKTLSPHDTLPRATFERFYKRVGTLLFQD